MDEVQNQGFLTIPMQKIINLLYYKKLLYFKNQYIYRDRQSFNNCMNILIKSGWVKKENTILESKFDNVYKLTLDGILLWEEFLIKLTQTKS